MMRFLGILCFLALVGPVFGELPPNLAKGPIFMLRPQQIRPEAFRSHWEGQASNIIYIFNPKWRPQPVGFQIFTDMMIPRLINTKRFPGNHVINNNLFNWMPEGRGWRFHIQQKEILRFEMTGSIVPEGDTVHFSADITNQDTFFWGSRANAQMAVRTGFIPDFYDLRGERTYIMNDKSEVKNLLSLTPRSSQYFRYQVANPDGEYLGWIRKVDSSKRQWIEYTAEPCFCLGGNRSPGFDSIQCDFHIPLKPGETSHLEAKIAFNASLPARKIVRPTFRERLFAHNAPELAQNLRQDGLALLVYLAISVIASLLAWIIYRWWPADATPPQALEAGDGKTDDSQDTPAS